MNVGSIYIICLLQLVLICSASAQWTKINLRTDVAVTADIMDVCFVNPDTGFIVTNTGVLYKSIDGGYHWTFDTISAGAWIDRICFPTPETGYMTLEGGNYTDGTTLKSTDGGNTWSDVGHGNHMGFANGLYFLNADTGMVGCGAGLFFRTINGGQTWHWKFLSEFSIDDIRFFNDSTGFIFQQCGMDNSIGSLTVTRDGGNTWTANCSSAWFDGFMYSCLINDSIYIGFSRDDKLCTGTIYGRDSTLINTSDTVDFPGFGAATRNIRFYNERLGMVAYAHGVVRTEDGGQTWVRTDLWNPSPHGITNSTFQIIVPVTADKWIVAGQYGQAFITENRGGVWTGIEDAPKQTSLSIYPNPTNNTLICTINDAATKTTAQIITPQGSVVLQNIVVKGNNFEIDVSSLASGLYFLVLQDEKQQWVKKFVKE